MLEFLTSFVLQFKKENGMAHRKATSMNKQTQSSKNRITKPMIRALLEEDLTTNNRTEIDYNILRKSKINDFDVDPRKDSLETIRELIKIRSNPSYQTHNIPKYKECIEQYITVRGIDRRSVNDTSSSGHTLDSTVLTFVSKCLYLDCNTLQKMITSTNNSTHEFDNFYFVEPPFLHQANIHADILEIYSCVSTREEFIEYVMNNVHHTNLQLRKDLFENDINSHETFEYLGDIGWGIKTFGENKIKDTTLFVIKQENGIDKNLIAHHFHYYGVDILCNDNICKLQELKKPIKTSKDQEDSKRVVGKMTKTGPEFLPLVDTNCLFGLIIIMDAENMSLLHRFFVPNWIFIRDLLNKT